MEKKDWLVSQKPPGGIYIRYVKTEKRWLPDVFQTSWDWERLPLKCVETVSPGVYPTGDWEEIPLEARYYLGEQKSHLAMTTQLGCGYGECTFCEYAKSTKHWPEDDEDKKDVLKWALANVKQCKPALLTINDACFLYKGGDNSIEILKGIKELREKGKLPKEFHMQYECRTDAFPKNRGKREKLIQLMLEAGTSGVFIGFESGSDRTLKEFRKGATLEQNVRVADALASAKLRELGGYFILTSPNSQMTDFVKTLQLIAYIAKKANSFKMSIAPTKIVFHRNAMCRIVPEREKESPIQKLLWPQDALLRALVTTAQSLFANEPNVQKHHQAGSGDPFDVPDVDPSARREHHLNALTQMSELIDYFLGQLGMTKPGINAPIGTKNTKPLPDAAPLCFGIIKRDGLADKIVKDYRRRKTVEEEHHEKWKNDLSFAEAVRVENEKLKEIIRTKDTKKARDILLGKYDKDFEELVKREAR